MNLEKRINMKKAILYIIAILFSLNVSFAQTVIEFKNKIDSIYLDSKEGEYYFISNISDKSSSATKIVLDTDKDDDEEILHILYNTIEKDEIPTKRQMFSVKEMDTLSIAQWENILKGKTFPLIWDKDELVTLSQQGKSYISTAKYKNEDNKSLWKKPVQPYNYEFTNRRIQFSNCVYIKLNDNQYAVGLIDGSYRRKSKLDYILIPYKNYMQVMQYQVPYTSNYDDLQYANPNYLGAFNLSQMFSVKQRNDEKQQLVDVFGQPFSIVADSIYLTSYHVVAYNKEENNYTIYNQLLEPFPYENISSVEGTWNLTLIIDGEKKILTAGHELLTPEEMEATKKRLVMKRLNGVTEEGSTLYLSTNAEEEHLLSRILYTRLPDAIFSKDEEHIDTFKLKSIQPVDSLFFTKRDLVYSGSNAREPLFFVKYKDGKYNIGKYILDDKDMTFSIEKILEEDCDHLEAQDAFIFYNNDNMGYYPLMHKAKYKKLYFQYSYMGSYLIYQKDDGTTGWIDIDTGKEHPYANTYKHV